MSLCIPIKLAKHYDLSPLQLGFLLTQRNSGFLAPTGRSSAKLPPLQVCFTLLFNFILEPKRDGALAVACKTPKRWESSSPSSCRRPHRLAALVATATGKEPIE